ncbi:hypothetical protein QBC32DRAFT_22126 [Pseudoneurospora amorphoporcata]|uniref:DUF7730 domain-containing protein n=1 Tax=Pseudoneurospora amorphoporcata TaxID=241081 RepID=A0AAN6SJ84_9PEZI|nr:hypothetical protein QBC32DRAFT_22126 [Pseudoneurospora amorphoporcata]
MSSTSTMSTMSNKNNKSPNFFCLPGEIRNQIYESLLVFSEPLIIHTAEDWHHDKDTTSSDKSKKGERAHLDNVSERKRWPLSSRLLTVFLISKQIHHEASAVFYSSNQFRAPPSLCRFPHAQLQSNYVMRGFIDRIGPRNLTCLRHLCIPFPLDSESGGVGVMGQRYMDLDGPLWASMNVLPGGALPSLWRRCPNVEVIEFDLSWSGPGHSFWKGCVRPSYDREVLLGSMDAALREEFKRLREIVVNIHYDGPASRREIDSKACEVLVEEMRGRYGWRVEVRDCSGEKADQQRLRIPYWHRPSPSQGFRWTGAHYRTAYDLGLRTLDDDDDDDDDDGGEHVKPTAERKRQFAKDVGRKILRSRAFGWSVVVIFSPTIPVLMAIDGINKRRRKRKNEKLSPGSWEASLPHRGSLAEFGQE